MDTFWGSSVKLNFYGLILTIMYIMGLFWEVAKFSNTLSVCLIFLMYFGVNSRCWVQAYVARKNNRYRRKWQQLISIESTVVTFGFKYKFVIPSHLSITYIL